MGLLNCSDTAVLILLDKLGLCCNLEVVSTSKEIASDFDSLPGYIFLDVTHLRETASPVVPICSNFIPGGVKHEGKKKKSSMREVKFNIYFSTDGSLGICSVREILKVFR